MAETANVVITIKTDQLGSNVDNSADINKVKKGEVGNSESDTSGMAAFKFFALKAGDAALNEGLAWGEYNWDKKLILNDDYVGQRNKRISMQQINKGKNYIMSALTGAALGAKFGPGGAVIGAVLGLGISIAGTARENAQAQEQQTIQINQKNAQLDFTRQRAGWSLEAASIGEDL